MSVEIDFKKAFMIALMNRDEGRTIDELEEVMPYSTDSISQDLKELREHGYIDEESRSGQTSNRYLIRPIAYNKAHEVLTKYWEMTTRGIQLMQEFKGRRAKQ